MSRFLVGLPIAALWLVAGTIEAQTPVAGGHNIPNMVEGEVLKPSGSFYFGGYSGSRDFFNYRVHFYEFPVSHEPADPRPEWIPWAVRLTGSGTQERRVEWVDGRVCPGAYSVRIALSDFPGASFSSPRFHDAPVGAGALSPPPSDMGAPSLALWGYARLPDMALGTMMVTGSDGSIRHWVDFAEQALRDCWQSEPPSGIATQGMLDRLSDNDPSWQGGAA